MFCPGLPAVTAAQQPTIARDVDSSVAVINYLPQLTFERAVTHTVGRYCGLREADARTARVRPKKAADELDEPSHGLTGQSTLHDSFTASDTLLAFQRIVIDNGH